MAARQEQARLDQQRLVREPEREREAARLETQTARLVKDREAARLVREREAHRLARK